MENDRDRVAGTSVVEVDYWACSRQEHQNDGFHYHCALKLTGCKKWLSVKNRIAEKHDIKVNFSDKHNISTCLHTGMSVEVTKS